MRWVSRNFKSVYDAVEANTGMAGEFLHPRSGYAPPNARQMALALLGHVRNGDAIRIVGDYDVDGVCASAGLYLALRSAGARNVRVRLPRRISEGYGLKASIVDEVDGGVIVTVDNGIAALEAAARARSRGLPLYIIDHHLPAMEGGRPVLPYARAIVDPHAVWTPSGVSLPYKDYCGAGLVYRIAGELIPGDRMTLRKIAAMAAVATVADVVPLTGDNRNIFREGVRSIREGTIQPGLQAIVDLLDSGNIVTEGDIGFKIGPMLNAPGRLYDDGAMASLTAVLSDNFRQGREMAYKLQTVNEKRKEMKEQAVARALGYMDAHGMYGRNPAVVYDPMTPEGVVGLVAGSLQEKFGVSAFAFTDSRQPGLLKGSCRGSERDDIKSALDKAHDAHPEVFAGYGGHKSAAGVTIHKPFLGLFAKCMEEVLSPWEEKPDEVRYDIEIGAGQIPLMAAETEKFAPYGQGNPPVVFCVRNMKLDPFGGSFYREMKKGTVKFSGSGCEVIGFGLLDKYRAERCPVEVDLVGTIGYRHFRGRTSVQVEAIDLKASGKPATQRSPLYDSIAGILKANHIG